MAGTKNCIRQRIRMHLNSSFPDGWRIKPSTFSLNLGLCNWWNASWSEALIFWSRAIVRGRWRRKIGRWRDYEATRWLDSWARCNTVDFTDCQYGDGYRGPRLSISISVDPQYAAGVNSPVKHIAPPRFNCSSSATTVFHVVPLRTSMQLIMM